MNRPLAEASLPVLPAPQAMPNGRPPAIDWKYAAGKPGFKVLLEPLFKLGTALAFGKQLDSF
jgi:hypothetical protein